MLEGLLKAAASEVVMQAVVPTVVAVLGGITSSLLLKAKKWIEVKLDVEITSQDDAVRARIDDILMKAAHIAVDKMNDNDVANVISKADAIREGVEFAQKAIPDSLKKFNVGVDQLQDMVRLRVGQVLEYAARQKE